VQASAEILYRIHHLLTFFFVCKYPAEATDSVTVQTHVFGIRVGQKARKSCLSPSSEHICILVEVPWNETQIWCIKNWKKFSFYHDLDKLVPLLLCRIAASRVVPAWLNKHKGSFFCTLEILKHAFKIKRITFLIVVPVFPNGNTHLLCHPVMWGITWVRNI